MHLQMIAHYDAIILSAFATHLFLFELFEEHATSSIHDYVIYLLRMYFNCILIILFDISRLRFYNTVCL